MHVGSIRNNKTAAARVYCYLLDNPRWCSGWEITTGARTTAVGTRISEVRRQLAAGERIDHCAERFGQRGSWYRLIRESEVDRG